MAAIEVKKHIDFLLKNANSRGFEWIMSEYLRMSGIYWSLTALHLLNAADRLPEKEMLEFVDDCLDENGGFSPAPGHYPSITYTLSAVQILRIYDKLNDYPNKDKIINFVSGLQNDDGSFRSYPEEDPSECDTRFSFCAVATLKLLGRLDMIDCEKALQYVIKCQNFDGAFGVRENSESHAGQVFCCVGVLKILNGLERIDTELLSWWLSERQLDCGGLNGRPMKKEDVCYSWWALSSLVMLGKSKLINAEKLRDFILSSQDNETGGFSDRPGDMPDPYHTLFGLAGISMLHYNNDLKLEFDQENFSLGEIDPVLCMPKSIF